MDPVIIAAIIAAIGTIIAAFIARQRNIVKDVKEEVEDKRQAIEEIPPAGKLAAEITDNHISKDFVIGILFVLICSVLFGGSHVLGKYIVSNEIHPLTVVTLRNIFSGIFILLIALSLKAFSENKKYKIQFSKDSIYMVLGRSLSGLFYFSSFLYLSATMTITLYKLNPIYTFIILLFFIKISLSKISFINVLIGVIVAVAGSLVTIAKFNGLAINSLIDILPGVLFVVLAGFFWSVFMVGSEKHESSQIKKVDLWQRQFYVSIIYLISAIPFIVILLFLEAFWPSYLNLKDITSSDILRIIPLGLFSGTIGILYFEALKRVSSLLVSVIISLEIFFTMVFENLILNQIISWNILLGATLIIIGAISVGRESPNLKC